MEDIKENIEETEVEAKEEVTAEVTAEEVVEEVNEDTEVEKAALEEIAEVNIIESLSGKATRLYNDSDYSDPAVDEGTFGNAGGSTANNEIKFEILTTSTTNSSFTYAEDDTNVCTDSDSETANMTMSNVTLKGRTLQTLGRTTTTCPGTSRFAPAKLKVIAPANGLGVGTYTISGTVVLFDGQ